MATIFIDGQAGTTGLEITERLAAREDLTLLQIDDAARKDPAARRTMLHQADIAILCLPDAAAQEAVALADAGPGQGPRILDASTAFRTDPAWAYGLPELCQQQRTRIGQARYVSNPGCYPQGFILLTRPLIDAGLLNSSTRLRCNAVSGYSGGGRQMIEQYQAFSDAQSDALNSRPYSMALEHKHVPEMHLYSTTTARPLFSPMVANYYKGMLVQVPLFVEELENASLEQIHNTLSVTYQNEPFVRVLPLGAPAELDNGYLNATACNNSNNLELMVFGNQEHILLVARYDNLGKGAAGAAVQNLNLMLGLAETTGL